MASRRCLLLPVAITIASAPTCDHDRRNRSPSRKPVCGGKIDGVGDLRGAGLLDAGDVGFGPDDLGAVAAVELLDALAGIAGDLAERIDGMGQHARQYLQTIIGGARLVGPAVAPAPN